MNPKEISKGIWEIPKQGKMLVPARIYATKKIMEAIEQGALQQVKNVAELQGIQKYSISMPDAHNGYGFPIGGVAAFDLEKGVVSPGGIGFDINCIKGNTKVLHEFGYHKKIKDFENDFNINRVKCFNPTEKIKDTKIKAFMKFKTKNKVFKVKTESGLEITATEEHPFFTEKGMIELKKINGEKISVYPFEGVEYKEPSDQILISKKDLRKNYSKEGRGFEQMTKKLKELNLLPLKMNNPKLPYLIKLMAFITGDGTLTFLKNGKNQIFCYGNEEDLEEIRKDIERIGFNPSRVYSRNRNHEIKTSYDTIKFNRTEKSIKTSSQSLALILLLLGTPSGNKTVNAFEVPKWLLKSPKWMKRLYLASFFGAELSSPATITNHAFNFNSPLLSINKRKEKVRSARKFLKQIKRMLSELGTESDFIKEREEFKNKKGAISIRLRLSIRATPKNLIKFWSQIGFEYNKKRQFLANVAVHYLKSKQRIIKERNEAEKEAKELHKRELNGKKIFKLLKEKYENINLRFVERSVYEGRKTSSRIAFNSHTFESFMKEKTKGLGKTGQVWDKIISKKEIPFKEQVYDFNVEDENHNFIANNFVVSNCGVRLIKTNLTEKDIKGKEQELVNELFNQVPAGLGSKGQFKADKKQLHEVMIKGSEWAIENGFGWKKDLQSTEENGKMKEANPKNVSEKAIQRGLSQLGSLGSGNHFLEIQKTQEIFDEKTAEKFGLKKGNLTIMIHCGSRGFGHQIASDYLETMEKAMKKYSIQVSDKQLACAPINSEEGKKYFSAMACAVNYAFANRQMITHWTRKSFEKVLGKTAEEMEMNLLYDVAHNIAKFEEHEINKEKKMLLVHRKGATRAFPAGRKENPKAFLETGHPAIIPGSMGTASWIVIGTEKTLTETFGSVAHGAGRVMSRAAAIRSKRGEQVQKELEEKGEFIKARSIKTLSEEMPEAYKDVEEVIRSLEISGIAKKVARLTPIGVVKG